MQLRNECSDILSGGKTSSVSVSERSVVEMGDSRLVGMIDKQLSAVSDTRLLKQN